jgi:hypothetical protein
MNVEQMAFVILPEVSRERRRDRIRNLLILGIERAAKPESIRKPLKPCCFPYGEYSILLGMNKHGSSRMNYSWGEVLPGESSIDVAVYACLIRVSRPSPLR